MKSNAFYLELGEGFLINLLVFIVVLVFMSYLFKIVRIYATQSHERKINNMLKGFNSKTIRALTDYHKKTKNSNWPIRLFSYLKSAGLRLIKTILNLILNFSN